MWNLLAYLNCSLTNFSKFYRMVILFYSFNLHTYLALEFIFVKNGVS